MNITMSECMIGISTSVPQSHVAEGAKPHLCILDRKRATPIRKKLSMTQAGLIRNISLGSVLA